MILAFDGDLEFDASAFELRRAGSVVPMEPQAFDVLAYLIVHRDRLVSKEELMDQVWGGRFVSETAVTSRIKQVRRALGDDGQAQRLIKTMHGRGYRFVALVERETAEATSADAPPARAGHDVGAAAPIRYTVSDGLHIAYQVTGGEGLDIVLCPGFISHLEMDWGDPRHAHFLHRLGANGRLIRFDKRGTGMSDRPQGVPDLETRMHDVLAVMDAVGSLRAALVGYSEGGPMSILLAATHPERVAALALYGCYAKRSWSEDYPWAQTQEARQEYTERLVSQRDWEADLRMRCPTADEPMQKWWVQRMRASATPSTVRALMDMNSLVDVRDALGSVRVPTLVLHRTGDPMFRVEEARYLAEHIPGARLELLDGVDHFVSGNPDQILDALDPFLRGLPVDVSTPLALAAIAAPAEPGTEALAAELVEAGGRLRTGPSDRPVVLFDGPARAVRAGLARLPEDGRLGLAIAEVPRDEPSLDAPGVALALALADLAPAGSIWLSSSVGDLLAGSGVTVEPVGEHPLGDGVTLPVFRAVAAS